MTEQETLLNILGEFSACNSAVEIISNGHRYTELCLTGGWLTLEFDESGKLIDVMCSN